MNFLNNLDPILFILGAFVAAVIFYRPFVGLLSMFFMIPLEVMVKFSAGFTAIKLVGIITFIAFMLHVFLGREKIKLDRRFWVPLILFLFWVLITLEGNYSRLFKLGQLIAFSMITIVLCYKNDRRLILVTLAFIFGGFIATFMAASGYLSDTSAVGRAAVQEQNANTYAFMAGMAILISLFLKTRWKGPRRLFFLGAIILFIYGLIICASRGAIVALCLSFLIYLIENKNRLKSMANILVIVLLVCTILVVGLRKGFITGYSVDRIKSMESLENTTLHYRFTIWRTGWKIVKENLITGVGLGNFPLAFSKYTGSSGSHVFIPGFKVDPHNTYLSILTETGVIGLFLFLSFLSYLVYFMIKSKNKNKVFALCLLAFVGIVSVKGTLHFTKAYWACISLSYLISTFSPQNFYSEGHLKSEVIEK